MTGRVVRPEILDGLSSDDPRARRSRADLRRINGLMGNARTVAGLLGRGHRRVLEIGAGDGAFARRVFWNPLRDGSPWSEARAEGGTVSEVVLLDFQSFPPVEIPGWRVERVVADVFGYLRQGERFDAIVANLFLHHFENDSLRDLLSLVAGRTGLFVACEPRRSSLALAGTRMLGPIGCNDVTRHDARVSVRAGFREREISALWPETGWRLEERAAGPFGHAFRAVRG